MIGSTKHFKIYTGYADVINIYEVLQKMAESWNERQITRVRMFVAGFTDIYLSITARRWYHFTDCNDPDYIGDAQDFIQDHPKFQYHYKTLSSAPHPEDRWLGQWRDFNTSIELLTYAQDRISRLNQQIHKN